MKETDNNVIKYVLRAPSKGKMLDLGFEPYGTLGSSFSWKRETCKEGYYTLGTIDIVEE